ncbi:MAG TPA: hypothetical protein PL033_16890 [Candidatus Brocadiia bacterium]|nr:hypothetical protein [Candidatus Brocadiia bacterium]
MNAKKGIIEIVIVALIILAAFMVYVVLRQRQQRAAFQAKFAPALKASAEADAIMKKLTLGELEKDLDTLWDAHDKFDNAQRLALAAREIARGGDLRTADRVIGGARGNLREVRNWISTWVSNYNRWRGQRESVIIRAEAAYKSHAGQGLESVIRLVKQVETYVRETSGEKISATVLLESHFKVLSEIAGKSPFGESEIIHTDIAGNKLKIINSKVPELYEQLLVKPPEPEEQDEVVRARMRYLNRALTILEGRLAERINDTLHPTAGMKGRDGAPLSQETARRIQQAYLKRTIDGLQKGTLLNAVRNGETASAEIDGDNRIEHAPDKAKAESLIGIYALAEAARNRIYGKLVAKLVIYPKPDQVLAEYLAWLCRNGHADRILKTGDLELDIKPVDLFFHVPDAIAHCRIEKAKGASFEVQNITVELKQEADNAWLPIRYARSGEEGR